MEDKQTAQLAIREAVSELAAKYPELKSEAEALINSTLSDNYQADEIRITLVVFHRKLMEAMQTDDRLFGPTWDEPVAGKISEFVNSKRETADLMEKIYIGILKLIEP